MGKTRLISRFLLVGSALTVCLSACGGSGSSSTTAAVSAAKTASWTNVSVRGLDAMVNINWDKAAGSSGATSGSSLSTPLPTYNIYCSINPTGIMQESNRIATNYSGQSFDHTPVTNGQRYYYVVTEITAAGEGPASRVVSATPQAVQPAAPYGLKVTALDGSAQLDFTPPAGTSNTSYNLYRSTIRGGFTDIFASNITFPYVDPNLKNDGTTYYYALKAVIAEKEGGFSAVVSARPQPTVAAVDYSLKDNQLAAFGSPIEMSARPGNGSCVVGWKEDAKTFLPTNFDPQTPLIQTEPVYILYWSDSSDVISNYIGQINGVTKDASGGFKLTGLKNGTTYYLQVVAAVKDASGKPIPGRFTPGPVVSVTPALNTPAIPSGVSATQGTGQVALSWNTDTSGITGVIYHVYFSTKDASSPAELMTRGEIINDSDNTKTHFTQKTLTTDPPGTTYYFVVTSVKEGESAPSSIVSVTL